MRFAYIDSQGKEVSIPSVEALQLRIELGAITEGTRFYDASTDRWAPAGEHEIFRTLSRESGGRDEGGFVAPPPPTRGQKRPGEPPPTAEPSKPARPRDPDPFEREMGPSEDEPSLDPFDVPVDESPPAAPAGDEPAGDEPAADERSADESSAADDFDFEGFGTIELDDSFTAPAKDADESGEDVAEAADVHADVAQGGDAVEDEGGVQDEEGGREAEIDDEDVAADDDGGVADERLVDDVAGDLDLEPPLSEQDGSSFTTEDAGAESGEAPGASEDASVEASDELPAWMADEDEGAASPPDASGSEASAPPPPPRRERGSDREPDHTRRRTRPTPPPRRGKESNVGRIVAGVAAVAILVVGGWYLLTLLGDGGEPTVEAADPAVEIPELPSELVSTFDETGAPAYAAALDSLRALGSELPEAPPDAWLGGNYLANASRFPGVRDYWGAVRSYLDRIRASGEELFVSLYEAELDSAGVAPGSDHDALVERARAGFQASRPDREVIYDQLEGLVDAAEGLDDFLRENEASIDYEPAAGGISRDPVVEAVPATEAMGEEMWDRVARITAAMDALGAVDRVRSELLLDILFDKLGRTTLY